MFQEALARPRGDGTAKGDEPQVTTGITNMAHRGLNSSSVPSEPRTEEASWVEGETSLKKEGTVQLTERELPGIKTTRMVKK